MPGTPSASVGGFYAAVDSSVAQSEHLKLSLPSAGPAVFNTIPQVASGKATFSLTDAGFVLQARSQGIKAVQVFAPYNSPVCVMFHPSEGIHSWSDLNGHTIAVTPGAPWWEYVKAKYHLNKVNVVNYSFSIAPFISNRNMVQQCFITNEPYVATHQHVPNQTLMVASTGFNLYDDVLFTTQAEIQNHPDVVRAVVRAVAAGWQTYWSNPGPINAKLPSLGDQESAAQMTYEDQQLGAIKTTPVGFAEPARMHQAADQMRSIGAISAATDANWQASFNNSFLPSS
ncbi:MAG: ABC transporter substrate-binding protein [Acidimicrobiaceae bacterium]|nr:ABC transporter substrate-binding protein [Acidimicrobiaceae bacterium]